VIDEDQRAASAVLVTASGPLVTSAATSPPADATDSLAAYHPSHARLLRRLELESLPTGRGLGCVVVPTNRPPRRRSGELLPGLVLGAGLAARFGCPLLVLRSCAALAHEFPAELSHGAGAPIAVVDLVPPLSAPLPDLKSASHPVSTRWRNNDVGVKRNTALLLSVMFGGERVLFLDDDVSPDSSGRTLDERSLAGALGALDVDPGLRAVGWTLREFDDNSVVGHARRLAGDAQDIFISSGALLTRCTPDTPFFPATYNEDWLFLFDLEYRDALQQNALQQNALQQNGSRQHRWPRALAEAGSVHQLAYEPYRLKRARSEELGDILAEGLFNLLDDVNVSEILPLAMDDRHWRQVLHQRHELIANLRRRFSQEERSCSGERRRVVVRAADALNSALCVSRCLKPELFTEFIEQWQEDLDTWRAVLVDVERVAHDLQSALVLAGLESATTWYPRA
jgi:hypothetical protein